MGTIAKKGENLAALRILIVEDEWLPAQLLADQIEFYGGSVIGPAATEEETLAMLDATAVEGALIDIHLGNAPCWTLVETVIQRRTPAILTTGYPKSSIPARFHRLPVFIKPFDVEELLHCMNDIFRAVHYDPCPI